MVEKKLFDILKSELELKVGRKIESPSDFDFLSADISHKTDSSVSSSTLKRLFGYTQNNSSFSRSTLNTLCRYLDYDGWTDFCAGQQPRTRHHKSAVAAFAALILVAATSLFVFAINNDKPSPNRHELPLRPKNMNNPRNVKLYRIGDFLYRRWFHGKAVTVECLNKNITEAIIPDSIRLNDSIYVVNELSFDCFKDCKHLKKVVFMANGAFQRGSFQGCDSLKVLEFHKSQWGIGNAGWKCNIFDVFDDHHFNDLTICIHKEFDETRHDIGWAEFKHIRHY